jgi:hypothetical protein
MLLVRKAHLDCSVSNRIDSLGHHFSFVNASARSRDR